MNPRPFLILATATLLFAGCATGGSMPASSAPPAAAPESGFALVYIIRDYAQPTAWDATVRLDGTRIAGLQQKSYTRVYVAAGDHFIELSWNRLSGQIRYGSDFHVVAGRTYYLAVEGVSRMDATTITMGSRLRQVDTASGEAALAQCRTFSPPVRSHHPAEPVPAAAR
jgi:hypothetical protein